MNETPIRIPPALGRPGVLEKPIIECGQQVRLRGKLVICIREINHPVRINYGHSNGIDEWCFDE